METYLLKPKGSLSSDPSADKALSNLKLDKNNGLIAESTAITTLETGKWYDLALVIDYEQDVYYIYLGESGGESTCIAALDALNAADYISYMIAGIYSKSDSSILYDDIQITEYVAGTSVAFESHASEIKVGRSEQLSLVYNPTNMSCPGATFTSSDETIATVDATGKVTARGEGTVTITATPVQKGLTPVTTTITVIPGDMVTGTIYSEDFENVTGDAAAYLENEGYTLGNANGVEFSVVEEDGNKVLKLDQPATKSPGFSMFYDLGMSVDKAVLKYRVKADTNDGYLYLPTLTDNNGTKYIHHAYLAITKARLAEQKSEDAAITIDLYKACVPNADMVMEEWYDMEIVVDTILRKYDVYLNGNCVIRQSDIYSDSAQTINSYRMGIFGHTVNAYYFDDIEISGYVQGTAVAFADGTPDEIHVGHTEKFELAFTPVDTSVHSAVFTSSDESIATVDAWGNVTGVKAGTVTITADPTLEGLANVTKTIIVKEKVNVDSVTVDKTSVSLPAGGHTYVNVTVAPANASFPQLTYSSSDESVATIDEWGEIVAVAAGSATITIASNDDATKKATVNVTVTAPTVAMTIYAAPNGSDTGTGTVSDKVSLKRAMELVAAGNDNMTGNIEVILEDGYYQRTETLAFTDTHSGTNGYSVIWKAAEGAEPIIGGGIFLDGSAFSKWSENEAIYVANVPAGTDTRQLFVNNVRATRARSEAGLTNPTFQSSYGYTCDDLEIAEWSNPDDLEMVIYKAWKMSRCSVDTATVEGGKLKLVMDQPGWENVKFQTAAAAYPPAWYENAIELLDEPGEWYLDRTANKLYYMPRSWEDMREVTVTIPVVEDLITVYGSAYDKQAENISFVGITFADTTWLDPSSDAGHADHQNNHINLAYHNIGNKLVDAAITVAKANSICFTDCTFTRLGITGLKMVDGVQNSMVVGNHFYDISGGAVNIGEPDWLDPDIANPSDKYMMMKNCDVLNNYIHNIGVEYESAAAVSVGFASDMDLSNNEIFNIPYSGFHIGYGWQMGKENILRNMKIANNFMHHTSNGTVHDGGAVYTIGRTGYDSDGLINTISGNYIKDQLTSTAVLYLDNGTTNWEVTDNVIDISKIKQTTSGNPLRWVFTNTYAENNLVKDNFTATKEAWSYRYEGDSMPYDYPTGDYYNEQTGNRFTNNTYCEDAAWTAEALAIIEASGLQEGYADVRNNQAEIITSNLSESGVLVGTGENFEVKVTYTDGKDKAIAGGNTQLYYEIADETLAAISADGVITGKAEGQTTVRVYVISNNILDVIEGEVFVGDGISEVKLSGVDSTVTVTADSEGKELDAYIITTMERVVEPDSVVYTVADTSIATVDANGKLIPAKVGVTTLTVKASLSGVEKTTTYTVNVVEEGTVVTNNLSDIFDSVNKDNWYTIPAYVVGWDYVEGEKLTAHLSSKFANYKGFKIQDEMLHFKLKIDDIDKSGDWPSLELRNQDYSIQVGGSGSTGYMIGFGEAGLEVFRFNSGTRKAFYSPASKGFDNEYGSIDASVFSRDVEHDVQVGAINQEDGVRLVLIVDGETVFDFVDEYSDGAIKEAGYFGISSQGHTFTFTKIEEEVITPTPTPTPGAGGEGEGTTPTPTPTPGEGEGEGTTPTPTPSASPEASETPDVKPEIILEGTDKSYTMGANATVSIHCTGDLDDLIGVKMDGKEVDEANYTLKEGSTIVTFKTEYLETLSVGDHTVTLLYAEGRSVDSTLTILAAADDSADNTQDDASDDGDDVAEDSADATDVTPATEASGPSTGDDSDLVLWIMLLAAAIGVCTYLVAKKRKVK